MTTLFHVGRPANHGFLHGIQITPREKKKGKKTKQGKRTAYIYMGKPLDTQTEASGRTSALNVDESPAEPETFLVASSGTVHSSFQAAAVRARPS